MTDSLTDCSGKEPFALQVLGDSMAPEFPDGCIIVIEPADQCFDGMYIMVEVEGVHWFRQYRKDDAGESLVAVNTDYPEIPLAEMNWKPEGIILQRNIKREIKHYSYDA